MSFTVQKIISRMVSILEIVCSILFILICIIVFIQVVGRFVLKMPTPWSEELARFLLVILVFLGTTVSINEKSHLIALDIFEERSESTRLIGTLIVDSIILLVSLLYARNSIRMSIIVGTEMAASMPWLKTSYLYITISLGFLISSFFAAFQIFDIIMSLLNRDKYND